MTSFVRRCPLASTGVLVAALLGISELRADDWPQWRGLHRDGVWRETGILEQIPATGLKIRWRAKIGSCYSGPVVAQGTVANAANYPGSPAHIAFALPVGHDLFRLIDLARCDS